jgi:hypothetical protein
MLVLLILAAIVDALLGVLLVAMWDSSSGLVPKARTAIPVPWRAGRRR